MMTRTIQYNQTVTNKTSIQEDLQNLTNLSNQANRYHEIWQKINELSEMAKNYMNTRSYTVIAADAQYHANKVHELENLKILSNVINTCVSDIVGVSQYVTEVGLTAALAGTLPIPAGFAPQGKHPYEAGVNIATEIGQSIKQYQLNKVEKEQNDILRLEKDITSINSDISQINALLNQLNAIKLSSTGRIKLAEDLVDAIDEKRNTSLMHEIKSSNLILENDLIEFHKKTNTVFTVEEILEDDKILRKFANWYYDVKMSKAKQKFNDIKEAEGKLCEAIDSVFKDRFLHSFLDILNKDMESIQSIINTSTDISNTLKIIHLAEELKFNPLSIASILARIDSGALKMATGGKIETNAKNEAIETLKNGIEEMLNKTAEKGITQKIQSIYILVKLDEVLYRAGVDLSETKHFAQLLGISEIGSDFVDYHYNNPTMRINEISLNTLLEPLFVKLHDFSEDINKNFSDKYCEEFILQKVMYLVYYTYQKLQHCDDSPNLSVRKKYLKNISVEMSIATMEPLDPTQYQDVLELLKDLRSLEIDDFEEEFEYFLKYRNSYFRKYLLVDFKKELSEIIEKKNDTSSILSNFSPMIIENSGNRMPLEREPKVNLIKRGDSLNYLGVSPDFPCKVKRKRDHNDAVKSPSTPLSIFSLPRAKKQNEETPSSSSRKNKKARKIKVEISPPSSPL